MPRRSFLKELLIRRVPQIIGSYFVAGTSLIFFIQYLVDKYQFPPHYPTLALFALVGILPSVIILSYFHGAPGKDQWTKLEKYAIPTNILFIATILLISFQYDFWKVELTEEAQDPQTVLIHITSLGKYKSEYEGKEFFDSVKGRKLVPLPANELDKIRKNVEGLLLGALIDEPIDIILPKLSNEVDFLDKYHILDFNDTSFANVSINYERFQPDHILYLNIFQYHNESKYFYRLMKWFNLPNTGSNGSDIESDFTDIEDEIFNNMIEMYRGSAVGKVSSVKDDIIYLKLSNINVKENMHLQGSSLYDYSKNGRQERIEDLTNGIAYLNSRTDSVSKIQIVIYNEEIKSIQDGTGFNWHGDNQRVFTKGFSYKLKVVDLLADSIAVTEVIELAYPYVSIRVGDKIWVE